MQALAPQNQATERTDDPRHTTVVDSLSGIKELGYRILDAIRCENFDVWGQLLHEHWMLKKQLSSAVSPGGVDELYDEVRARFGVLGGKIIGAGGGGFLMLRLSAPAQGARAVHGQSRHAAAPLHGRTRRRQGDDRHGGRTAAAAPRCAHMMTRAVFLDRDGVLNDVVTRDGVVSSPRHIDEFRLRDEARDSLPQLAAAGFRLFVVTNQPDVARGMLDPDVLALCNERLQTALPIEAVHVCPHDDHDACDCRKPKPGLIHRIAGDVGVTLSDSYVIGDSWKDVAAGRAAGCRTILLRRSYNTGTDADHVVASLAEAVRVVLADMPSNPHDHIASYLHEVQQIADSLDRGAIDRLVNALVAVRARGGRLFLLGVGGSAANASHATNDFRKICGIEAYVRAKRRRTDGPDQR